MKRLKELILKQKATLIGVCSLGLAGLIYAGIGETWRINTFCATLYDTDHLIFTLKLISFILLSALLVMPFFIVSNVVIKSYGNRCVVASKFNKSTAR